MLCTWLIVLYISAILSMTSPIRAPPLTIDGRWSLGGLQKKYIHQVHLVATGSLVMSSVDELLEMESSPKKSTWKEAEYGFYRYFPNSTTEEAGREGKVPSTGFSLTMIGSSACRDREHYLREEVAKKMCVGTLFEGNGQVTDMNPIYFIPPSQIYYCLLHTTGKKCETTLPTSPTRPHKRRQYILAFALIGRAGLELFRADLDNLAAKARDLLPNVPIEEAIDIYEGSALESLLDEWFTEHVQYITRVVKLCPTELPVLLHVAVNSQLEVAGTNEKNVNDVKKFLTACSLANLMKFTDDKNKQEQQRPTITQAEVTVTVSNDSCSITSNSDIEATSFCSDWAQVLLAQGTADPDPFFLRQAVENYKLKIVQDLNAFKRLLRQAESDYHALYRCYLYLCVCGNGKLLLQCVTQEAATLPSPSTLAVLKALQTFSEKNGFRKITSKK